MATLEALKCLIATLLVLPWQSLETVTMATVGTLASASISKNAYYGAFMIGWDSCHKGMAEANQSQCRDFPQIIPN